MDDKTPPTAQPTAQPASSAVKQAACLNCRRSKTRCIRKAGDTTCRRCIQTAAECVIPDYRVGRKKGIKNKREGLDKAVFCIEQAIKKSRIRRGDGKDISRLQSLLREAREILPRESEGDAASVTVSPDATPPLQIQAPEAQNRSQRSVSWVESNIVSDDNYSVDDAENPLQLLARASDLSVPSVPQTYAPNILPSAQILRQDIGRQYDLQTFFGPIRANLDLGEDIDPVDMGLVNLEETDMLFNYFYQNLSHTRWGLDRLLHTPTFVRSRSAFLFTSILAASALFMPSTPALSRRLSTHCRFLARHVTMNRYRSPEIVLAFMINIPWMSPGKHWSDDETCSFMASALTIAIDISLDKVIVPSFSNSKVVPPQIAQSECIAARKALDLDGFQHIAPSSALGRRLLRCRERVWLALFVLDRGVCLARGRSYTVPVTPLIESCDEWHKSDLADIWDGSIISSTVLRRDLVNLITTIKDKCHHNIEITSSILQEMIEGFFTRWYATWAFAIGGDKGNIPPYVEILVTHGRLSIYSSVINHPTAPIHVKRFFRSASLSSALNVMRAAVQGESRLKSMPNNTVIMISFAAMICFRLSTMGSTSNQRLAPSIRILIEETADVLERIGTIPPHRKGISAIYGRHLRNVIGGTKDTLRGEQAITMPPRNQIVPKQPEGHVLEPIQFSAMSDDQIVQTINNSGEEFGNHSLGFQIDERSELDWLDWFNMDVTT